MPRIIFLKDQLIDLLENNMVKFNNFYFAYCRKQPKSLNYSEIVRWDEVDEGLQEIIKEQLKEALRGNFNQKNFLGEYIGHVQDISRVKSINIRDADNKPAHEILEDLVSDSYSDDSIKYKGDILANKYLSIQSSVTSIYAFCTFDTEIDGVCHRFIFLTTCDLEEKRIEPQFDEESRRITTTTLLNVFKKKNLTKGALFPFTLNATIGTIMIYDDNTTQYWFQAFECRRRLTQKKELDAMLGLLARHVKNGEIATSELSSLGDFFANNNISEIGPSELNCGLRSIGCNVDENALLGSWERHVGDIRYRLSTRNVLGEAARNNLTIKLDDIEIKCRPNRIKQIFQFAHQGEIYLVLQGTQKARIPLQGNDQVLLISETDWETFKSIVEG